MKEATRKVYSTFFSNRYLLDKFIGKEQKQENIGVMSSWESESILDTFRYSREDKRFSEFAEWVESVLYSQDFLDILQMYEDIEKELNNESAQSRRIELIEKLSEIRYG